MRKRDRSEIQSLSITTKRSGKDEAKTTTTEELQPISPMSWMFQQPHLNLYAVVMMGIGVPSFDLSAIRVGLQSTFLCHPRFSSIQVVEGNKPHWLRTKVDVDQHIVMPDLDVGPDLSSSAGDQLVEDYVAGLSRGPHPDPSRPLWDLHLLCVRTSHSDSVAVLRLHHSLGDGASIMSLILASARKADDPTSLPALPDIRRRPASPRRFPWSLLLSLWAALVLAWHTAVDVVLFAATATFLSDSETPLKGGEGVEWHPKRFVHRTIGLGDVKAVKNAMGCTINDVLVGVTSAALSRYLSRKHESGGDTIEGEKKRTSLLAKIHRLRSVLIVNVRPTPGIQALADMMKDDSSEDKWRNRLGYVLIPFPMVVHQDPLEYVRQGKAITDRNIKKSLEAILTHSLCNFVTKWFGIKPVAVASYRVVHNTTLTFSNMIGPAEEISLYGHPVVYIAPSVYGHPHTLTVHFLSYASKMSMVLAVDELAIPDPHQLLDDLVLSLQLMKNAS